MTKVASILVAFVAMTSVSQAQTVKLDTIEKSSSGELRVVRSESSELSTGATFEGIKRDVARLEKKFRERIPGGGGVLPPKEINEVNTACIRLLGHIKRDSIVERVKVSSVESVTYLETIKDRDTRMNLHQLEGGSEVINKNRFFHWENVLRIVCGTKVDDSNRGPDTNASDKVESNHFACIDHGGSPEAKVTRINLDTGFYDTAANCTGNP